MSSIINKINQAKQNKLHLAILVKASSSSPSNSSNSTTNVESIFSSIPVQNLLKKLNAIILELNKDSTDGQNFINTFKSKVSSSVSSLSLIYGPTGNFDLYFSDDDVDINVGKVAVDLLQLVNKYSISFNNTINDSENSNTIHESNKSTENSTPENNTPSETSKPKVDIEQSTQNTNTSSTSNLTNQKSTSEKVNELNKKLEDKRRERMAALAKEQVDKEKQRRDDGIKTALAKKIREEEAHKEMLLKQAEERRLDREAKKVMQETLAKDREQRRQKAEEEKASRQKIEKPKEVETALCMLILPTGERPRQSFNITDTFEQILNWSRECFNIDNFALKNLKCQTVYGFSDAEIKVSEISKNCKTMQLKMVKVDGDELPNSLSSEFSKPKSNSSNGTAKPNYIASPSIMDIFLKMIFFIPNMLYSLIKSLWSEGSTQINRQVADLQNDRIGGNKNEKNKPKTEDSSKRTMRFHDLKRDDNDTNFNGNSTAQDRGD